MGKELDSHIELEKMKKKYKNDKEMIKHINKRLLELENLCKMNPYLCNDQLLSHLFGQK